MAFQDTSGVYRPGAGEIHRAGGICPTPASPTIPTAWPFARLDLGQQFVQRRQFLLPTDEAAQGPLLEHFSR